MKRKYPLEAGEKFGLLTVITDLGLTYAGSKSSYGTRRVRVVCGCGTEKVVSAYNLTNGSTMSCGCTMYQVSGLKNRSEAGAKYGSAFVIVRNRYIQNSRRRKGLGFHLNDDLFYELTQRPCLYCGAAPSQVQVSRNTTDESFVYNGVDRLDSSVGYVPENCVTCCGICNVAKLDRSPEEFVEHCNKVTSHQKFNERQQAKENK